MSVQTSSSANVNDETSHAELKEIKVRPCPEVTQGGKDLNEDKSVFDVQREDDANKEAKKQKQNSPVKKWAQARPSLGVIESIISTTTHHLTSTEEMIPPIQESNEDVEEVFHDTLVNDGFSTPETEHDVISPECFVAWKKELEVLVQGGVPRNIRGEVSFYTSMSVSGNLDIVIFNEVKTNLPFAGVAGLCWCTNTTGGKLLPEFAG